MGCGAAMGQKLPPPPTPQQLPKKPTDFDFPLWNKESKDKLKGKISPNGDKAWKARYGVQKKLFMDGADFTDQGVMDTVRKESKIAVDGTVKVMGYVVMMDTKQDMKKETVDANKFIGETECKLRPGYTYDNKALKLLVFTPKKKEANMPAVVLVPPTACFTCEPEQHEWLGHKWAATLNAVVILVGFRDFPTPHLGGVMDVVAAIKWTHAKAANLSIDTSRVALATQSVGGIMACPVPFELVMRGEESLLKCVILESPHLFPDGMYGTCDNMCEYQKFVWSQQCKGLFHAYAGSQFKELEEKKDPALFVMHMPEETVSKAPKHHIICAEFDDLVWVYYDYAKKLKSGGVLSEFVVMPEVAHENVQKNLWMGPKWYADQFLKNAV